MAARQVACSRAAAAAGKACLSAQAAAAADPGRGLCEESARPAAAAGRPSLTHAAPAGRPHPAWHPCAPGRGSVLQNMDTTVLQHCILHLHLQQSGFTQPPLSRWSDLPLVYCSASARTSSAVSFSTSALQGRLSSQCAGSKGARLRAHLRSKVQDCASSHCSRCRAVASSA